MPRKKIKLTYKKLGRFFIWLLLYPFRPVYYGFLLLIIKMLELAMNMAPPKCPRCGNDLFMWSRSSGRWDCTNCTYKMYEGDES